MPLEILSSPLLSLPTIDLLLSRPGASEPTQLIQLLSAKLYLLQNPPPPTLPTPSNPSSTAPAPAPAAVNRLEVLALRVQLAETYLKLVPPDLHTAETEAMVVDDACKKVAKRAASRKPVPADVGGEVEQKGGTTGVVKNVQAEEDIERYRSLRVRALQVMVKVEEGLGREGRAKRTQGLLDQLQAGGEGGGGAKTKDTT